MEQQMQPAPTPPRDIPDDEIDLRDIILVLWRHRWFIVGIFLVSLAAAAVVSLVSPKVYRASAVLSLGMLPGGSPLLSQAEAKEILEGGSLRAGAELDGAGTTVSVEPVKGTSNLVTLSVEAAAPDTATHLVEELADAFLNDLKARHWERIVLLKEQFAAAQSYRDQLTANLEEAKQLQDRLASGAGTGLDAEFRTFQLRQYIETATRQRLETLDRIIALKKELTGLQSAAVVKGPRPAVLVKPRTTLNIALAGVLGLMIGVLGAFVIEFFRCNPLPRAGGSE